MVTTTSPITHRNDLVQRTSAAVHAAECALHVAHQSGVDLWIDSASEKLHRALARHYAALATDAPLAA